MVPLRVFTSFSLRGFLKRAGLSSPLFFRYSLSMPLLCAPLKDAVHSCGYFDFFTAVTEHFFLKGYSRSDLDTLLERGYRHFGKYFFRPRCGSCVRCVPIRVRTEPFRFSRNARRVINRASGFRIEEGPPEPTREAYELYARHLTRFDGGEPSDRERFTEAFFDPLPGSRQLSVYHNGRLIALSHFDRGHSSLSAVYTYYDDSYIRESLGRLVIYELIRRAREERIPYLYLGYYIEENRHMVYKKLYKPNEVLTSEGSWRSFYDADGRRLIPGEALGFVPGERFFPVSDAE